MSLLSITPFEQQGFLGALQMADASNGAQVYVLKNLQGLWFREWRWNSDKREPDQFWWVPSLVCARGFESKQLCESFQTFLRGHGFSTEVFEVAQARLLHIPSNRTHPR